MEDEVHAVLLDAVRPLVGVVRLVALVHDATHAEDDQTGDTHDDKDLPNINRRVVLLVDSAISEKKSQCKIRMIHK